MELLSGCPSQVAESTVIPVLSEDERPITKAEMFKYYLAIDQEIIREAQKKGKAFMGLQGDYQLGQLDTIIAELIKADVSDSDIDEMAEGFDGLSGNILKKIGSGIKKAANAVGKAAKKVANAVTTVVKKAAQAVKYVVTLPLRAAYLLALKTMKGRVAKAFVYAFIPDNDPLLKTNPEVKRKSEKQKEAIQKIRKGLSFQTDFLMKHIRNAIKKHYGKNPEQVIHDLANKKDKEFNFSREELNEGEKQLGDGGAGAIIAAGAGLITAVGGLVVLFKKQNLPSTSDWEKNAKGETVPAGQQVIPDNVNVTNDPAYNEGGFIKFLKSPVGITLGVLTVAGTGYGVYKYSTN